MIEATKKRELDLKKYNGDDSYQLPLGATYIIDRDAAIRYAFADVDPSKRAKPAAALAALRGMKKTH